MSSLTVRSLGKEPYQVCLLTLVCLTPFQQTLAAAWPVLPVLWHLGLGILTAWFLFQNDLRGRVSLPFALLLAWLLVSLFRADNWDRSFSLWTVWVAGVLLGGLAKELTERDSRFPLRLCLSLWVLGSFIAVLAPGQVPSIEDLEREAARVGMDENMREAILHSASQARTSFPFGNPIHLGLFLTLSLLSLPVLYRQASQAEKPWLMKTALAVTAMAQLATLWSTRSRTPLLSLLAGTGLWVLLKFGFRWRWIAAGILALAATLSALAFSPAGREMLTRVETVRARAIYWEIASRMVADHPLVGFGVGGYGDHYPAYRQATPHQTQFPHNLPLEVATDLGAVGVFLFTFLLCSIAIRWYRSDQRNTGEAEGSPLWRQWILVEMSAFGLATLVDFPHAMLYLLGIAAPLLGVGLAGLRTGGRRFEMSWKGMLPLLILALLPGLLRESSEVLTQEARALHAEAPRTPPALRATPSDIVGKLERALLLWPPNTTARHYLGRFSEDLGLPDRGGRELEKAIEWSPNTAYLYEDLALLLWKQGKKEEALEHIDQAIAKHPIKWNYHATRARFLHELGRTEEAEKERRLADELEQYEPDYEKAREASPVP
jgi:hypothetical protein